MSYTNLGSGEICGLDINLGDSDMKLFFCFGYREMRLFNGCISRVENRLLVNAGIWKCLEIGGTRTKWQRRHERREGGAKPGERTVSWDSSKESVLPRKGKIRSFVCASCMPRSWT